MRPIFFSSFRFFLFFSIFRCFLFFLFFSHHRRLAIRKLSKPNQNEQKRFLVGINTRTARCKKKRQMYLSRGSKTKGRDRESRVEVEEVKEGKKMKSAKALAITPTLSPTKSSRLALSSSRQQLSRSLYRDVRSARAPVPEAAPPLFLAAAAKAVVRVRCAAVGRRRRRRRRDRRLAPGRRSRRRLLVLQPGIHGRDDRASLREEATHKGPGARFGGSGPNRHGLAGEIDAPPAN